MGRCSPLSGSDPRFTVDLVVSHRPDQEESCPEVGSAGSSPAQEEWTVYTERGSALQAARLSHDGLWVPSLEVRCSFPYQEAAGNTVQVSSRRYWCTLVHQ
jgi:hypothetical protein